jgi:hypothetical protein
MSATEMATMIEERARYTPVLQREKGMNTHSGDGLLAMIGVLLWTAAIPLTVALVLASQGRLRTVQVVDAAHALRDVPTTVCARLTLWTRLGAPTLGETEQTTRE